MAGEQDTEVDDDDALNSAMDDAASAGIAVGPGGSGASFQFRDTLRTRGYEVPDEVDDDAFLNQLEQWSSRASVLPEDVEPDKLPTLLQAGREFEQHRSEFEQWRASRQQQQAAPQQQSRPAQQEPQPQPQLAAGREAQAAKAAEAAGFSLDEIRQLQSFCQKDPQSGIWVPKHPSVTQAAEKLNEFELHRQRTAEELLTDPHQFFSQRFVPEVERLLEERLGKIMPDIEAFRQFQAQQLQQQFIAPIVNDLYVLDENGSVKSKTPRGEMFERAYAEAPQGLTELQRLEYARNAADSWALRNPPQQQQAAKPGLFSLNKQQAAAPGQQAAAGDGKQPSDQKTLPESSGEKRRRFVDRLRKRGEDGKFISGDRSGTVKSPVQNTKRQSARDIYLGMKSGEIPVDGDD